MLMTQSFFLPRNQGLWRYTIMNIASTNNCVSWLYKVNDSVFYSPLFAFIEYVSRMSSSAVLHSKCSVILSHKTQCGANILQAAGFTSGTSLHFISQSFGCVPWNAFGSTWIFPIKIRLIKAGEDLGSPDPSWNSSHDISHKSRDNLMTTRTF